MWSARRKFMTRLGGVFLGSGAILLQSGKLQAGRRSHGGSCGPCPQVCSAPPLLSPCPPLIGEAPLLLAGSITLLYPSASVTTIPGGGDYCVWGGAGSDVKSVDDCYMAKDTRGTPADTQPGQKTDLRTKMGADWGWAFGQYASKSFYIAVAFTMTDNQHYTFISTQLYNTGSGG